MLHQTINGRTNGNGKQHSGPAPRLDCSGFHAARVFLTNSVAPIELEGVARLRPGWLDFSDLESESRGASFVSYPERRIVRVEFLSPLQHDEDPFQD